MLRYYDETGLLRPAKVDKWTGHRLYSATQIPRLNRILYLRDSGFNIAEISLALEMEDALLLEHLTKKRSEIEQNIRSQQEKLRKIAIAENQILAGGGDIHYNISIKSIPEYQVLSLRKVIPTYYSEGDLWKELSAFAEKQKIALTDHSFSIYHDTEYKEQNVDVELCVEINTMKANTTKASTTPFCFRTIEPVNKMACTMVYGDFSNIAGAYTAFANWLQKDGNYKMSGPTRQIVHRGPWNETDSQKYLTELQIPLYFSSCI